MIQDHIDFAAEQLVQDGRLDAAESDISDIEADIVTIQGDITQIGLDQAAQDLAISAIEGDITTIEGDIGDIQAELSDISDDQAAQDLRLDAIEGRLDTIEANPAGLAQYFDYINSSVILFAADTPVTVWTDTLNADTFLDFTASVTTEHGPGTTYGLRVELQDDTGFVFATSDNTAQYFTQTALTIQLQPDKDARDLRLIVTAGLVAEAAAG